MLLRIKALKRVLVEMDSQAVLQLFQGKEESVHAHSSIIDNIMELTIMFTGMFT